MQKLHYIILILSCILLLDCSESDWYQEFKIIRHELDIQIEPEQQVVFAKDQIYLNLQSAKTTVRLLLDPQFEVDSVFFQGKAIKYKLKSNSSELQPRKTEFPEFYELFDPPNLLSFKLETLKQNIAVEVFFHGKLKQISVEQAAEIKKISNQIVVALPNQEAVLVSNRFWYPRQLDHLTRHQIAILTPQKYEAITVGKLISRLNHESGSRLTIYDEANPVEPISLFAGVYSFTPMNYGDWEMFSYFFPKTEGLAERYFDTATHALDRFHQTVGDYQYEKFAIVSSPIPVSQAFPSFCIIDSAEIHRKRTANEVTNHFVCQNWWGQSVFCKPETGDWTEGLTTYLADHYQHESVTPERAADARYHYLREYALKVPRDTERPLAMCLDLTDSVQFTISKSKGTLFFHHLRKRLGDTIFYEALREIYKNSCGEYLSWWQLRNHFEKTSQTGLDSLFDAWVKRIEPIQLELKNAKFSGRRRNYTVTTEVFATNINREDNNINMTVPMQLRTRRESFKDAINIQLGKALFKKKVKRRPISLQLDPDFDFFRRLTPGEIQPFIGEVLKSNQKIIVLPGKIKTEGLKAYREIMGVFNTSEVVPNVKFDNAISAEELKNHDLVIFGSILENEITRRIHYHMKSDIQLEHDCFVYEKIKYWKPTHALVASLRSPFNAKKRILLYWGIRPGAILNSVNEVEDLQDYGFIILRDGLKVTWRQWSITQGPLYHEFD